MRNIVKWRDAILWSTAGVLAGIFVIALQVPSAAQQIALLGGSFSGAVKAVAVTTDGYLQVAIQGGSAAFTAATTFTIDALGAGPATTGTTGVRLLNTTAATVGTPAQWSPPLQMSGSGWDTDDLVSRTTDCYFSQRPVSAATVGARLQLLCQVASGGETQVGEWTNAGNYTGTGNSIAGQSSVFGWTGRTSFSSPADSEVNFTNNAGTANAGIRSAIVVEANTGAKSPSALENNELYTNTGDADGSSVALLDNPTVGTVYRIVVTAAQTITITAASGETLKFGASTCGTSLTSNTVGSAVSIVAAVGGSGGIWITLSTTGTWVCNA